MPTEEKIPVPEKETESAAPVGRSRKSKRKIKTGKQIIIRRIIILSVLEVITLFCIFSYAYVKRTLNQIQHPDFAVENVENKDLTEENLTKMKGYWNIAAFGVDSRDNSVGKGNNSDVIMIISINQETGEVRICSVFRDSYMSIGNGSYN
jgi:anionic cell wall polymer biosynthesis LytR-Cps2A-Psr (LCP) family protein